MKHLQHNMAAFCWPPRPSKHHYSSSSSSTSWFLSEFLSVFSVLLYVSLPSPSVWLLLSPSLCAVFVFSRPACLSNSKYPCYLTQIHLSTWPRTQRRAAVCVCVSKKKSVFSSDPLPSGLKDWVNTHKHTLTHSPPSSPLLWDKTQV